MEERVSLITLGVDDLDRCRTFYERLGWEGQEAEQTVFFKAGVSPWLLSPEALARIPATPGPPPSQEHPQRAHHLPLSTNF